MLSALPLLQKLYQPATAQCSTLSSTLFRTCRLLEEALKAMLTALPLVQELHHPALRDRHWQQLMNVRTAPGHPACSTAYAQITRRA